MHLLSQYENGLFFRQKPAAALGTRGTKSEVATGADVDESRRLRAEMEQLHTEMKQMRASHEQEMTRLQAEQTSLKAEIKALRSEQQQGKEYAAFIRVPFFVLNLYCILPNNFIFSPR